MEKWENYGDVNFAEYGGILLRQAFENDKDSYDFVEVLTNDEGAYVVNTGIIDVSALDPSVYTDNVEETSPMEIAANAIQYYGGEQISGEYGQVMTKQDLYDYLAGIGFECENKEVAEIDSVEYLGDRIEEYLANCKDYVDSGYETRTNALDFFQDEVKSWQYTIAEGDNLPFKQPEEYAKMNEAQTILKALQTAVGEEYLKEEAKRLLIGDLHIFNVSMKDNAVEFLIDCDRNTMSSFLSHADTDVTVEQVEENAIDAHIHVTIRDNGEMDVVLKLDDKEYPVELSDAEKEQFRNKLEETFKEQGLPSIEESLKKARQQLNSRE